MQATIVTVFLALSISAPWIFKKWGARGEWAWGLTTMAFLLAAISILSDV
jgi:hypothetical protein